MDKIHSPVIDFPGMLEQALAAAQQNGTEFIFSVEVFSQIVLNLSKGEDPADYSVGYTVQHAINDLKREELRIWRLAEVLNNTLYDSATRLVNVVAELNIEVADRVMFTIAKKLPLPVDGFAGLMLSVQAAIKGLKPEIQHQIMHMLILLQLSWLTDRASSGTIVSIAYTREKIFKLIYTELHLL